jgi:hypothetical protein
MASNNRDDPVSRPVEHIEAPAATDEATLALSGGPIGAYIIAGIAVALLFIGWLAFYVFLFLPRGPIG